MIKCLVTILTRMTINLSRDANELILVMDMERKKKKLKKNFSTVRRIVTSSNQEIHISTI